MAAGVLFRDVQGRVAGELTEELGWDRPLGRLLVVDYVRPQDSRPEGV